MLRAYYKLIKELYHTQICINSYESFLPLFLMKLQEYLEEIRYYEVCYLAPVVIKLDYPWLDKFWILWITTEVMWRPNIDWLCNFLTKFFDHIELMFSRFLCFKLFLFVLKHFAFVFVDISFLLKSASRWSISWRSSRVDIISSRVIEGWSEVSVSATVQSRPLQAQAWRALQGVFFH